MSEEETALELFSSKDNGVLYGAVRELYEAGLKIREDPRQAESGPGAAQAVADYLDVVAQGKISEVTYVCKTKDGEIKRKQQFGQEDYAIWEKLADMLRNPETYKGDTLAVAKAWEVLHERGSRFKLVAGDNNRAAETLSLTFGWAASYIGRKTGVVLGIPHNFEPNQLPYRYCFIP